MTPTSDPTGIALSFANALAARDYATAYAMTAGDYRERVPLEEMRAAFEAIVPEDWGAMGPIEPGHTMDDWPGKQPADVRWVYVTIGGDVFAEAITVIVSTKDGTLKVRNVEFGRP